MEEYKLLRLGGKYGGVNALVDPDDYDRCKAWSWQRSENGYAFRTVSYGRKRTEKLLLHRFIMGDTCDKEVDHINGDKLDNRKANLRLVTRSQNIANRPKRNNSTTPYKGVRLANGGPRWRAYISAKEIGQKHLGCFETAEEAAQAYDAAALELWGQYASLNFPK